jgi:YgiT-type zinc finger domain-containing protein
MECFFCKGALRDGSTTHVVNFDGGTVIVKHVPCMECAQCGETYYSDEVASRLEEIVNSVKSVVTEVAIVSYTGKAA